MDCRSLSILLILSWTVCYVKGDEKVDALVRKIVDTFHSRAPTIIFEEYAPEICISTPWVLCVAIGSDADGQASAEHFLMQSKTIKPHSEKHETGAGNNGPNPRMKHDVLIFLGGIGQRKLVTQLNKEAFTIFTSDNPVFMAAQYANAVKLRLDSNIIFIAEDGPASYKLVDIFAVKGGPPISMDIGIWNFGLIHRNLTSDIHFMKSTNRWDRRKDLHGTSFLNALSKFQNKADFIRDTSGYIVGSKGLYQDKLFYVTDRLNLTVQTVEAPWDFKFYENGSYGGGLGLLQRKKVDVFSLGLGINLKRSLFIDYSMPASHLRMKLIARKSRDAELNILVYLWVFGGYQWIIFMALLLLVGMGISISIILGSEDEKERYFGIKRGTKKNYHINSISSGICLVLLYVLQMGSHTNSKKWATRLLTLTASILTFLAFVFYTTDITAKMTSGPGQIPIKNFDDVIHHDYKVLINTAHTESFFKNAGIGTARQEIYQRKLEKIRVKKEAIKEVAEDPKCLLYTGNAPTKSEDPGDLTLQLETDNIGSSYGGFGFQKNSEFVQIFTHYILKALEIGLLGLGRSTMTRGFYKTYEGPIDGHKRQQNFETVAAYDLSFKNVVFCFICLGMGAALSLTIATVEFMAKRFKTLFVQHRAWAWAPAGQ